MEDAMSRSFEAIRKQAQSTGAPLADIQQKHLGTDYIAIGKKLANKWRLPEPIALAIWLYTSNTAAVSETLPDAGIARVIQLADLVSAQSGIGIAENYQTLETPESIAESLGISSDQLEQIRQSLPEAVDERAQILGLDLPDPLGTYCQVLQKNVPQLVSSNSQLSAENKQLLSRSSHLDFATEFLLSLDSKSQPIDIAENFALRWQRFYQTSAVCLYLRPAGDSQVTEAIVVDDSSQCKAVLLHNPTLPELTSDSPLVFDSSECADWLFSQVPVDFDLSQTKLIPLVSNGRAVGAIVFELHYPADPEQIFKKLRATADIAAAVLDIALAAGNQQNLAEKFVRLLRYTTVPREVAAEPEKEDPLDSLAEMAAGAAHELNNPLSIISGRAQLLRESEDDPKKEKTLKAIQKNAGEIASIIDSLMSFAKPAEPRLTQTDLTQIIDEAKQLATHKISDEQTDFHIDLGKVEKSVTVDSAQIATSIANIFSNALESYDDGIGPIKVTAEEADGFIKIQISDSGCGMDEQTVKNAAYPFFSAKPAGRKRGIGLALAKRLINLNGGSLNIKSDPASGTNVTITLPC
jgi:signal transduction histidine kinase